MKARIYAAPAVKGLSKHWPVTCARCKNVNYVLIICKVKSLYRAKPFQKLDIIMIIIIMHDLYTFVKSDITVISGI